MEKTVLITGGITGIGLATAKQLREDGFEIIIIDKESPKETINSAIYYQCDITNFENLHAEITNITQNKNITHVFSNAGIHLSANLKNTSIEQLNRVIDVNLKGTLYLLKSILPHLCKNNFGRIVLNASEQAHIGKPNSVVYGATKAAIAQIAKSVTLDHAKQNIIANAICPGTIDTPLYQNAIKSYCQKHHLAQQDIHLQEAAMQPVNRIGNAEEVASLVSFLFSGKADYIAGTNLTIDGGYTAG